MNDIVRYIVVVHGIGQQRKNETVRPVIQRLAQARSTIRRQMGAPITLGQLASQLREAPVGDFPDALETGWVEFEGIPQTPDGAPPPFVGRPSLRGSNLRFVDLHWSSVTEDQFAAFGEPVADWTRSLIDRLEIRRAASRGDDELRWMVGLLHTMRAGVIPLQKFLSRRDPELTDTIFNRFLGDVQLYGEYLATRGMAVRRFHERLARLEARHYELEAETGRPPRDPRYTVVAHSLGSIMSFDALLFAHVRRTDAGADGRILLERLPEYDRNPSTREQDGYIPNLDWIHNVDALVTLGSPIDKFLVLWWLNYEHLVAGHDQWLDAALVADKARIRHYNYCDEQDPVGHALDVAYSKGAVPERIFEKREDRVYTRYALPGVAHVGYWTDAPLFRRILDLTVDGKSIEQATAVRWFSPWAYLRSLTWSYVAVPLAGWLVATAAMMWALLQADTGTTRAFWVVLSLGVLLFTCWLMRLLVEWREILVNKSQQDAGQLSPGQRTVRTVLLYAFRGLVVILPVVWLYLVSVELRSSPCPGSGPCAGLGLFDAPPMPVPDVGTAVSDVAAGRWGALVGWAFDALRDDIRWLFTWSPGGRWVSGLVATTFGFLIGLWNLAVFARIRWRYRGRTLSLDFSRYVHDDPTRAVEDGPA